MNNKELIQIKAENGLLSVKLENAGIKEVLKELARQTGLEFEGVENAEGMVTQEFENLPLDEGLRKISQSFIMILKKSGESGDALSVKKVIIVSHKGMPGTSSGQEATSIPQQPGASPGESMAMKEEENKLAVPSSVPPHVAKVETEVKPKTGEKAEVPSESTSTVVSPQIPTQEKSKPATENPVPSSLQAKEDNSQAKADNKKQPAVTAPVSSSISGELVKSEKNIKEKRWDLVIKNFKRYLEQNPSDTVVQERLEIAKQNVEQAVNLYKQAQKSEEEGDFKNAYEYYKKSYDIYPLLYDTWEKMRGVKKKIK